MAWFLLRHALSTVKPYSDSMEKSQYGPPQDVLAPPYPGFPAGNQGSGGGTAYPPQPGFQGGPQPSMYPPPPQPSMYPTPLQYGTDMAQPTNAPGIHRGKREPNSGHTSNPGGGSVLFYLVLTSILIYSNPGGGSVLFYLVLTSILLPLQ
ncbi:acidic proline-rich protein PRP25-like isoform X5 [Oncorhynchus masou masou]|uniref:acidic proline-rich protein PRP25-like isoform X5 n=1 Tax=Oncorhynchus masou masou TaxID=90313 RepID=UPI0031831F4B